MNAARGRVAYGLQVYDHARFETRRKVLRFLLTHIGFRFLVKIDGVEGLEHFPLEGPAILMINHIAFVDPIVVLGLMPRDVVPMAKVEAFHYPIIGVLPRIWGAIPVHREETDRAAIRAALQVLEAGEVVLLAPEGTRNPALQRGKLGVAYLATRANAPVVPAAVTGTQGFPTLRPFRWNRSGARVRVGRPFRFRWPGPKRPGREALRRMTDEAMYVLAAMLPEGLRGVYSDLDKATQETIEWLP
jgi:1-acyl-sn-glycerol-3-phosphate acyltransferase